MIVFLVVIFMWDSADTESGKCYEFPEYGYYCTTGA